jgi:hypothetical protein
MTSTTIHPYKRNLITAEREFLPYESGKHTLGFDYIRENLWGALIMVSLDLTIMYSFSDMEKWPIWIEGETLDKLDHETQIALANKKIILENTGAKDLFFIEMFLNNIVNAVNQAKEVNGGVVIW